MMKDCHEVSQPWRQEVCLCAVRSPCGHRERAHVRDKNGVMKDEFLPHPFSCLSLRLPSRSPIHSFMHLTRGEAAQARDSGEMRGQTPKKEGKKSEGEGEGRRKRVLKWAWLRDLTGF